MRWREGSKEEIKDIRQTFLQVSDRTFVDLMKLFAKDDYCSPEVLRELGRTTTIRARMKKVGFIPPATADPLRPSLVKVYGSGEDASPIPR